MIGFIGMTFSANDYIQKISALKEEIKQIKIETNIPDGYITTNLCVFWSKDECNKVIFSEGQNRYNYVGATLTGYDQCKDYCLEYSVTNRKIGYDPITETIRRGLNLTQNGTN